MATVKPCIRLQFVMGRGLSSRVIAWWGSGYPMWSHVDAVLSDGTLAGARVDSVGGKPAGFQIRPQGYENWIRRRMYTIPTTAKAAANWELFLRGLVGSKYDSGQIWDFILGTKRFHTEGRYDCSAAQTAALQAAFIIGDLDVPPHQITPDTLAVIASLLA